jgi:hypothetical protein
VVLLMTAAAFWAMAAPAQGPSPYGPSSTARNGAKALLALLEQLGDKVTTSGGLPAPGKSVALVLYDQLDGNSRAQLTDWVRRGGTLVVADPTSTLEGAALAEGLPDQPALASGPLVPGCQQPWVRGVSDIAAKDEYLLNVPGGATACFVEREGAFAVARSVGAGTVVSLGGADIWSNAGLAEQDDALLAADLLAPGPGYDVAWLTAPWVVGGDRSIWSLVPGRVKVSLAGLAVAVLVACLWRARRLGRPVLEDPAVPIPGSEIVLATGRLMARNRRWDEAATVMRDDLCGQLRARFGQGPGADAATVARVAAMHSGLPRDEVVAALSGPPPRDEAELVRLARSLQRIRRDVLSGATASS